MGSELNEMQTAAFHELGRTWNQVMWSILFVIAVMADVWAVFFPSIYPWSGFLLGLFSGVVFAGLVMTLRGRRYPPSHPEAAKTR